MDAYSTIKKITPNNPVVMLRVSDFCELFDGRLNPEDKKNLLDHVANQLKAKEADSK